MLLGLSFASELGNEVMLSPSINIKPEIRYTALKHPEDLQAAPGTIPGVLLSPSLHWTGIISNSHYLLANWL